MKKVTFVISEARIHDHLSIMALSASLKGAGHDTSLVFFPNDPFNKKKIIGALREQVPDIIAFSFMSCVKDHYIDLGNYIKKHMNVPIIIGGPAATFDKHFINFEGHPFDAVCVGEGDLAIVDFVESYEKTGQLRAVTNFAVSTADGIENNIQLRSLIDPLDVLAFPDKKILYDKDPCLKNSKIKMFMASRGCPYKCTYCFNHKYNSMYKGKGHIVRHKTVDYFLEEIRQVKEMYPLEGIIFEDDIFIMKKDWLEEFAEKYPSRIGLPYMCYVRPNLVTEDIGKLLKNSGCHSARVAIECGNEDFRNRILKRNLTNEQTIRSCEILHAAGLKVGTINIVGLPTETIDDMKETLALNKSCKPEHVSVNMFMPLPGVDLTFFAIEQGLIDANAASPKSTHHISDMKYSEPVRKWLYPFKALFPLMVRIPFIERLFPLLRKLPRLVLKVIDTGFRIYSNTKCYPPAKFSLRDKLRILRRYIAIISG
ncbi:MAG: B12-binding domain-containing radical SAM protein [Planctomycetes bacterium]|nr:B12-binding domain-containing radical SAM protein [Planctomycetota bacterium]